MDFVFLATVGPVLALTVVIFVLAFATEFAETAS
jgi:hypothetical protein